jgi:hypothetical protein
MVNLSYNLPKDNYQERQRKQKIDITNLIPLKRTEIKQENQIGRGILGYTILSQDYMVRLDTLEGKLREEVDVHELIHNEWEYQTDILAKWIISEEEYKKY